MKKFRLIWSVAGLLGLFLVYQHFKPDTFFSNLGLSVPQSAIISHRVPVLVMMSEIDEITLQMPSDVWKPVFQEFRQQSHFRDMTPALVSHYPEFVKGREDLFPASAPIHATAGEFRAHGRDDYDYLCRFLRDDQTGQVWLYAWSPDDKPNRDSPNDSR